MQRKGKIWGRKGEKSKKWRQPFFPQIKLRTPRCYVQKKREDLDRFSQIFFV